MASTLKIGSKLPMSVRIMEPVPNPEKLGDAPELKSAVINGAGNGGSGAEGVTEVDADLYRKWVDANPHHPAVSGNLFREVSDDEARDPALSFGFEPGLKALADDADNTKVAAEGSTVKDAGPVSAKTMAATSDVPNDDSPRSQTNAPVVAVASTAPLASAPIAQPVAPAKK